MDMRSFLMRVAILSLLAGGSLALGARPARAVCGVRGTGCCVTDDGYTCCYENYGSWSWCAVDDNGTSCQQGCTL